MSFLSVFSSIPPLLGSWIIICSVAYILLIQPVGIALMIVKAFQLKKKDFSKIFTGSILTVFNNGGKLFFDLHFDIFTLYLLTLYLLIWWMCDSFSVLLSGWNPVLHLLFAIVFILSIVSLAAKIQCSKEPTVKVCSWLIFPVIILFLVFVIISAGTPHPKPEIVQTFHPPNHKLYVVLRIKQTPASSSQDVFAVAGESRASYISGCVVGSYTFIRWLDGSNFLLQQSANGERMVKGKVIGKSYELEKHYCP